MLCASASYVIPDFLRITSMSTVIVPSEKSVWFNFTTQACYGIKFNNPFTRNNDFLSTIPYWN